SIQLVDLGNPGPPVTAFGPAIASLSDLRRLFQTNLDQARDTYAAVLADPATAQQEPRVRTRVEMKLVEVFKMEIVTGCWSGQIPQADCGQRRLVAVELPQHQVGLDRPFAPGREREAADVRQQADVLLPRRETRIVAVAPELGDPVRSAPRRHLIEPSHLAKF